MLGGIFDTIHQFPFFIFLKVLWVQKEISGGSDNKLGVYRDYKRLGTTALDESTSRREYIIST